MATIKSYTDIEQSKKLTEILPLESADMHYSKDFDGSWFVDLVEYTSVKIPKYVVNVEEHLLPCWSIVALLDALPKNLNTGRPSLESNYNGYYWIQYYDEFMKPNNYKTECFNNPVDACYEMVVKLHENKLL